MKETGNYEDKRFFEFQASLSDRKLSQSGGIAYVLASAFIEMGGVVYGCVLDGAFRAVHVRAEDLETVERMRGSKYVQSDMTGIYAKIGEDLKSGRKLLFIGMTCQVNEVWKRFGVSENLFLTDIICHGVASPLLFADYLRYWERKKGSIQSFKFRDKKFGWRKSPIETIMFQGARKANSDIWAQIYYSHNAMRPSCYHCNKLIHHSDLTIGDCWEEGGGNHCKRDNYGTSIVLPHTDRGRKVLEALPGRLKEIDGSLHMQPPLYRAIEEPAGRDRFWEQYEKLGFDRLAAEYGYANRRGRARTGLKIMYRLLMKKVSEFRYRTES